MGLKLGYLLPTREQVMEGRPEAAPLLALADRAEALGYDSVWVGDSLLARPRHEPLTLLAGVAGRTRRLGLGTAVLLPAYRNPVLLAHQVATLDQISQGRVILGIGIAADHPRIRAEFAAAGVPFERRIGRLLEGLRLCRALWSGEEVTWDGRWTVPGMALGPVPHRPGGPPVWGGGSHPDALRRAGRHFDGWFPTGPDAATWGRQWAEVRAHGAAAGRDPAALTGALYLTLAVDDDRARGEARLHDYLERYYGQPPAVLMRRQACHAGPVSAALDWMARYVEAGASHIVLRFCGEHERNLEAMAALRGQLPA